jgi:hypothetical protein
LDEQGRSDVSESESDDHVSRKLVGLLKAHDVHLAGSAAGLVVAAGDLSIANGGCGPVLSNGNVAIRNGGCGPVIAKGDASIERGGTQAVIAAGGATIGRNAFVGVVASPKVTIEEGGRVLLDSPTAIAVGAGVGLGMALLARLMRREASDPVARKSFWAANRQEQRRREDESVRDRRIRRAGLGARPSGSRA